MPKELGISEYTQIYKEIEWMLLSESQEVLERRMNEALLKDYLDISNNLAIKAPMFKTI